MLKISFNNVKAKLGLKYRCIMEANNKPPFMKKLAHLIVARRRGVANLILSNEKIR